MTNYTLKIWQFQQVATVDRTDFAKPRGTLQDSDYERADSEATYLLETGRFEQGYYNVELVDNDTGLVVDDSIEII